MGQVPLRDSHERLTEQAGLEPGLLDEVVWWHTDDYWRYALFAAVALIRATAARQGIPIPRLAGQLAERHGVADTS